MVWQDLCGKGEIANGKKHRFLHAVAGIGDVGLHAAV